MKIFKLLLFMICYWCSFLSSANNVAVVLYDGENLTGESLEIIGDTPNLGKLDAKMSSFELSPGYTIQFFLQENFQGGLYSVNSRTINTAAKLNNLLSATNNKVRSVKVVAYDSSASAAGAIFPRANFGGQRFEIKGDIASLSKLGKKVGSFEVEPGYEIRFYAGENFQGGYYSKNSESTENADPSYGDQIGSLRIIMRNGEYIDGLEEADILSGGTGSVVAGKLFDEINWGGTRFDVKGDIASFPAEFDGKMSSFQISPGYELRFYTGTNFTGGFWTRDSRSTDERNIGSASNKTRSVKIMKSPVALPAGTTTTPTSSSSANLPTDGTDVKKLDGSRIKDGWYVPYSTSDDPGYTNRSWMSAIPDDVRLASIAIPGTTQSAATRGGVAASHQILTIPKQLDMGIRFFDVRAVYSSGSRNLEVYNRGQAQYMNVKTILDNIVAFLRQNDGEAVIVRVKHLDYPTQLANWTARFNWINEWTSLIHYPSSDNPTLGEIRGKLVLIHDHYGASKRFLLGNMSVQDLSNMTVNWALYDKWVAVKEQFAEAGGSKVSLNYLSAEGVLPYFVASGKSSWGTTAPQLWTGKSGVNLSSYPDFPRVSCWGSLCSINYAGTNQLTNSWLEKGSFANVGIVVMSYPGPRLVNNIIQHNLRHLPTVKRFPPGAATGNNFRIYSGINQRGMSKTITSDIRSLGSVWDNRMQSYYVPYGWIVRFYEHDNFQGRYWSLDGGRNGLKQNADLYRFDRMISSIKIIQDR